MTSAHAVKSIRLTLGLNHEQFAELFGITASAISHYEAGRRVPRANLVKEILNLAKKHKIKVSAEDFFN